MLSCFKGMAQAPGGISTNLEFWVKAGTGAGSIGSNSSLWQDQSGQGHNATQATAAAQPVVTASQINFNPALVFNGTSDFMSIANNLGLGGIGTYEIYCVVLESGSGGHVFLGSAAGLTQDIQLATFPEQPDPDKLLGHRHRVAEGTTNLPAGTSLYQRV